jgi:transposase-like protein
MSFVRAKEIPPRSGNWYDYEVMTVHNSGKVQQKVIQYLGKSGSELKPLVGAALKEFNPALSAKILANITDTPVKVMQPKADKSPITCKVCDSQNTRKYGTYKGVQDYYCNDCHTKFTGTDALSHGRVSPSFISNAVNEYYNGMSFHDIENNIEKQTDADISHTAIIKWVNKYTDEAVRQKKTFN